MTPQRRIALTLGVTQTYAYGTTFYLPAVIVGPAAEDLGLSRALLLGGFSAALIISGLCAPHLGRMIDDKGGRGLMAISSLIMCVGLLGVAGSPGVVMWYAAWAVIGVGMAMGLYEVAFASIGRLYGTESRPIITNVTLIAGFASTIAWPAGTALMAPLGWRGVCVLYALLHLALNLPLVLAFIPKPSTPPLPAKPKAADPGALAAARRVFILIALFFTTRAVISSVMSVHAIAIFEHIGLATAAAVGTASLFGPGQVAGRVLEVTFGQRLNALWSTRLGSILLPLGALGLILLGPSAAIVFAIGYGMSNGILTINRGTLPMALFGPAGYAALIGKLAMPSLIASAIAPTLVAPLIDGTPGMTVIATAGGLAALVALCLIPLRLPQRG